jgi:hypothetical protein
MRLILFNIPIVHAAKCKALVTSLPPASD